ncbi:FkbM family methyltransferase [Crocinitomicaceae bacterium]|nr:FkbM family methyltransferase [Crocinitomicaceae bacterium]
MKNTIKYILQFLLGYSNYLYVFAIFKIKSIQKDHLEKDFFHFLSLLKDGEGDVIDIGANLGIMSFHLSKSLKATKIHAFEPVPSNLMVLRKVMAKYKLKNIELYPYALGDKKGSVEMVLPYNGKTIMQGLSHVIHDSIDEWNEGERFDVFIDKLDDVLPNRKVQGIKVDVENFEYFVFKGGEKLIEDNLPIIYTELWDNENRTKCFEFLKNKGYKAHLVIDERLVPFDSSLHQTQNFIFIPSKS